MTYEKIVNCIQELEEELESKNEMFNAFKKSPRKKVLPPGRSF